MAWPRLRRSWVSARAVRAAAGKRHGSGSSSVEARICARCTARVPARLRSSPPPMCMRQELSAAVTTSARVSPTARCLSVSIAVETSGFLTAKVPPKPQHSSASGSSISSSPRTARSSRSGASPRRRPAQRVAGRVVGHAVRVVRAHVLDPEPPAQELAQLPGALGQRRDRRARGPSPRRTALGDTTTSDSAKADANALAQPRGLGAVAGVEVHLPAAGLLEREVDLAAQPLEQPHHRAPGAREERVVEAGDEQGDTHGGLVGVPPAHARGNRNGSHSRRESPCTSRSTTR